MLHMYRILSRMFNVFSLYLSLLFALVSALPYTIPCYGPYSIPRPVYYVLYKGLIVEKATQLPSYTKIKYYPNKNIYQSTK